jgi:hypothetical protein
VGPSQLADEDLEPDLEDIAGSSLDASEDAQLGSDKKSVPFVTIDGISVHKANILCLYSHLLTTSGPKLTGPFETGLWLHAIRNEPPSTESLY